MIFCKSMQSFMAILSFAFVRAWCGLMLQASNAIWQLVDNAMDAGITDKVVTIATITQVNE